LSVVREGMLLPCDVFNSRLEILDLRLKLPADSIADVAKGRRGALELQPDGVKIRECGNMTHIVVLQLLQRCRRTPKPLAHHW
jgi:hypothetical protein